MKQHACDNRLIVFVFIPSRMQHRQRQCEYVSRERQNLFVSLSATKPVECKNLFILKLFRFRQTS